MPGRADPTGKCASSGTPAWLFQTLPPLLLLLLLCSAVTHEAFARLVHTQSSGDVHVTVHMADLQLDSTKHLLKRSPRVWF